MTADHPEFMVQIIGISAISGGGKTALTKRLAEILPDAVALYFDDYDESSVMPESVQSWSDNGADYDAFLTPLFTDHIHSLKEGKAVSSPVNGSKIGPAKYVVVDAPLGRAHSDSGKYFGFMVFIDTPLDVAMARRVVRKLDSSETDNPTRTLTAIRAEVETYLGGSRRIYTSFVEHVRPTCDLVLDGGLSLDELASIVISRLK